MSQPAMLVRNPWLLASLIAGISFFFVKDLNFAMPYQMAWKGAGVALLAAFALVKGGKQIAAVMAFGALGDVLIEWSLVPGAIAFLIGHLIAIQLYWRHRRSKLSASQNAAALAMLVLIPAIGFLLPTDRAAAPGILLYSLGLAAMTAAAWTSSFPRYRVGLGAVMFAASDLLIFSRFGPLAGSILPGLLIWPLYYFGQFLICVGVIGALRPQPTPQ